MRHRHQRHEDKKNRPYILSVSPQVLEINIFTVKRDYLELQYNVTVCPFIVNRNILEIM